VIRQQEDQGGIYVLDLKRLPTDQISGVWWFYRQGRMPHGMLRGTILNGGSTIQAVWHSQDGQIYGDWQWQANPAPDAENRSAEASIPS
jgi:hypothetical protein